MKVQQLFPAVAIAIAVGAATPAAAATLTCGGDVQFTLTVSSGSIDACVTGNGTLNHLHSPYDSFWLLDSDPETTVPSPQEGWFTIDTPTFTIDASAWTGVGSLALVLHLPTPSPIPDWAVFILGGGVLGGSWSNTGTETLARASLYQGNPLSLTAVPEPASLLLLGSGLLGLTGAARARRRLA